MKSLHEQLTLAQLIEDGLQYASDQGYLTRTMVDVASKYMDPDEGNLCINEED